MLVSESDYSKVYFRDDRSDLVVITFAHADFDFVWAQQPLTKLGIATIGVVSKGNHWYPQFDFFSHIAEINLISKRFEKRIAYGYSMGAYAAIKYSKCLAIDATIALSPQFSIDPDDVKGIDGRFVHLFRDELNKGMRITPADVAGRVFAFYDPYEALERWNVEMISVVAPHTRHVLVPRFGHETIYAVAGTKALKELIDTSCAYDESALIDVVNVYRKRSKFRAFQIANGLLDKHPGWAWSVFNRYCEDVPDSWLEVWRSRAV